MLVFISLVAFVLGLFLAVISVEAELTPSRCHVRITLMSKQETSSVLSGRAARLCPGLRIYVILTPFKYYIAELSRDFF